MLPETVTMYFFHGYKTRTSEVHNVTAYVILFHQNTSTELRFWQKHLSRFQAYRYLGKK